MPLSLCFIIQPSQPIQTEQVGVGGGGGGWGLYFSGTFGTFSVLTGERHLSKIQLKTFQGIRYIFFLNEVKL